MGKQLLNEQSKKLFKLTQLLEKKVIDLEDLSAIVPGVLHVNSRKDLAIEFMSKTGCDIIRYSNEELKIERANVFKKHQSDYTLKIIYPKLIKELEKDDKDHVITFIQDWRHNKGEKPFFGHTTIKILNDDQMICVSCLTRQKIEHLTKTVSSLFGIDLIFEKYFTRFKNLTKREKEILKLLGKELTRKEISYLLFIDEKTVKKHCENIYRKLETNKRTELERIAAAFSYM